MSKALSLDLRIRVLEAVSGGANHREAAARFGVGALSVSRWDWFGEQPDLDPSVWCSLMRPGPKPTWHERTDGRPRASTCAWLCPSAIRAQ